MSPRRFMVRLLASSRPPHRRGDYGNRAIWVLHGSRGNEPLFHRERRPSEKETRIVICAGSYEGNRTAVLRREGGSPGKSHNTGGSLSMKNGETKILPTQLIENKRLATRQIVVLAIDTATDTVSVETSRAVAVFEKAGIKSGGQGDERDWPAGGL